MNCQLCIRLRIFTNSLIISSEDYSQMDISLSIRNTFAIKINELISLPGTGPEGTKAIKVEAQQSTADH